VLPVRIGRGVGRVGVRTQLTQIDLGRAGGGDAKRSGRDDESEGDVQGGFHDNILPPELDIECPTQKKYPDPPKEFLIP
jgi:hypothetical protein